MWPPWKAKLKTPTKFSDWKVKWWWVQTTSPINGYGDEMDGLPEWIGSWGGQHSSLTQLMNVLEKVDPYPRIRVKLISPTRRYEFFGYAFRAEQWLKELRQQNSIDMWASAILPYEHKTECWPVNDGIWTSDKSLEDCKIKFIDYDDHMPLGGWKPFPKKPEPKTDLDWLLEAMKPWQWQQLAAGKLVHLTKWEPSTLPMKISSSHAASDHKIEAYWSDADSSWHVTKNSVHIGALSHDHMQTLCWGMTNPLHKVLELLPVSKMEELLSSTGMMIMWNGSQVQLTAQKDVYNAGYVVKGFGHQYWLDFKQADNMTKAAK